MSWLLIALLAHLGPYDRSDWKHWTDSDHDCQNERAETLVLHSIGPLTFATDRGCRVTEGTWIDIYSGKIIHDAAAIDIDHIIPLGWAHTHGADNWTPEEKKTFANDPDNLVPVSATLNRQKGKKGPDEWRPPSNLCGYGTRWVHLLKKYELMMTVSEFGALAEMNKHCDETPLPYYR